MIVSNPPDLQSCVAAPVLATGVTTPLLSEHCVSARAFRGGDVEVTVDETVIPLEPSWATASTGAPNSTGLLGSALAACLLINLARSRALLGFEYAEAQVEVVLRRQDSPPKIVSVEYVLRITTDEPARRVEMVHTQLRELGTVYNTLAAVCDVRGTVTGVSPT